MIKTDRYLPVIVLLFTMFTGCASLLPSSTLTVRSPWEQFDSAQTTYDKIAPGRTTVGDLKTLGFDPCLVPNIMVMNATEQADIKPLGPIQDNGNIFVFEVPKLFL